MILPWLELIKYQDQARALRYLALLEESAERQGDARMLEELEELSAKLAGIEEINRRFWLFGPESGG